MITLAEPTSTGPRKNIISKNRQYHHGDLRNSLITASFELISKKGPDDFALVDAARLAGVSSAAPYRHFRDKEELLKAVTEHSFNSLNQFLATTTKNQATGTLEHILVIGEHYLRFITEHPGLFKLMWGEHSATVFAKSSWENNSNSGFNMLVDTVTLWLSNEHITGHEPRKIAALLWASALGFASMSINHQLEAANIIAEPADLLDLATRTLLSGLKTR